MCPRCHGPFLAVEEATPVAPRRQPDPPSPPDRKTPRPRLRAEPVAPPPSERPATPPPDPHDRPLEGGLPASVLVGLALLPFVIPLLWLLAPLVTQSPALSLAAPAALAVAAAALSLAVIYTVDWTPATRVKGVLMLVGLSYFAGFSLYFLKKDMVDRVKRAFDPVWQPFVPPGQGYEVRLPGKPTHDPNHKPLDWPLDCYHTSQEMFGTRISYWVGVGDDREPGTGDAVWFAARERRVRTGNVPLAQPAEPKTCDGSPGREWVLAPEDGVTRVVRVYRVNKQVYYLEVVASGVSPEDEEVTKFTESLKVLTKE